MSAVTVRDPEAHPLPLEVLQDRYRLLLNVSDGRFGALYRGVDQTDGSSVAIRLLPLPQGHLFSKERFLDLQVESAQRARRVDHAQAVPIYDVITAPVADTLRAFVVTKWVDALPLASLIAQGNRLEPARAVRFVRSLADALHAAHTAGVHHLGLDPTTILVPDDDLPLITHFGPCLTILQDLRNAEMLRRPEDVRFIAPEIVRLGDGDVRSDVYSLGRIAKVMVAGDGRAPARSIPDPIRLAIVQATQTDPTDRPETMQAFVDAMGPLVGIAAPSDDSELDTVDIPMVRADVVDEPAVAPLSPPPSAASTSKQRWVLGLLLLLAAFGSAWALLGPDEAQTTRPTSAIEPAAVEPAAVEPAVVEPAVVEPAVVEPAAVEPAAVEPAETVKPNLPPQTDVPPPATPTRKKSNGAINKGSEDILLRR